MNLLPKTLSGETLKMLSVLNHHPKLSYTEKKRIYSGLGSLLESSIDILTAIEILIAEEKKKSLHERLIKVKKQITEGASLTESLVNAFSITRYEEAVINAGEQSGKLSEVLNELGIHFNNKLETRRELITILSYPALVLSTCVMILYFMLEYMVPMFMESFSQMEIELPYLTRVVIKASESISYLQPVFYLIVLVCAGTVIYARRNRPFFERLSYQLFRISPLAKILARFETRKFLVMMTTLLSSSVQFTEALLFAKDAVFFPPFEEKIQKLYNDIIAGESINEAFKNSGIFPLKVISMIRIAEETNSLDLTFRNITNEQIKEAAARQKLIKAVAEPVLILIMGLITGVILISMYLPIFQMSMPE